MSKLENSTDQNLPSPIIPPVPPPQPEPLPPDSNSFGKV